MRGREFSLTVLLRKPVRSVLEFAYSSALAAANRAVPSAFGIARRSRKLSQCKPSPV